MTDRELLELATRAAGIPGYWAEDINEYITPCNKYQTRRRGDYVIWNPLTDDGDALRLAVNLGIVVSAGSKENRFVCANPDSKAQILEERRPDPFAATRRAIVRAAAEIGEEVK